MKKTLRLVALSLTAGLLLAAAPITRAEDVPPLLTQADLQTVTSDLQALIPRLLKEARIPGLEVALVRDGKIVWHQGFGVRNAATGEPVTDDTIFEAASFTKPFFAYYVMKLVDQGLLDLDKPLIGYLSQPAIESFLGHPLDEPGFHRDWLERITARQVLSHSSGMPHGENGRPYPLLFEPGTKWKYSSGGYFFLQKVVEALKGDKLENLIQKEVLGPLGMTKSCLVWRDDYATTEANGHDLLGKPQGLRKYTESHAAATLCTTAEDYAKFVCAVLNGEGLRPETLARMLTLQIDMDKERGLGWSLGFGTQTDANGLGIWQWGDYGIFRNFVIAYPKEKAAVIYLTNSFYGLGIGPTLVSHAIGGRPQGIDAEGYPAYDAPLYKVAWPLMDKGPDAAADAGDVAALAKQYPEAFAKKDLGSLVSLLEEAKLYRQIVGVLEYNIGQDPRSGQARLDLAKAYMGAGENNKATSSLEKAMRAKEDPVEKATIVWNLEYLRALDHPYRIKDAQLRKFEGVFGPRHVEYKDGVLSYYRESGTYPTPRPLKALHKDTFFMPGVPDFRLRVVLDKQGSPVKLIGMYADGRRDDFARNK